MRSARSCFEDRACAVTFAENKGLDLSVCVGMWGMV